MIQRKWPTTSEPKNGKHKSQLLHKSQITKHKSLDDTPWGVNKKALIASLLRPGVSKSASKIVSHCRSFSHLFLFTILPVKRTQETRNIHSSTLLSTSMATKGSNIMCTINTCYITVVFGHFILPLLPGLCFCWHFGSLCFGSCCLAELSHTVGARNPKPKNTVPSSRKSKLQNPKPKNQDPESKIPTPKSKASRRGEDTMGVKGLKWTYPGFKQNYRTTKRSRIIQTSEGLER